MLDVGISCIQGQPLYADAALSFSFLPRETTLVAKRKMVLWAELSYAVPEDECTDQVLLSTEGWTPRVLIPLTVLSGYNIWGICFSHLTIVCLVLQSHCNMAHTALSSQPNSATPFRRKRYFRALSSPTVKEPYLVQGLHYMLQIVWLTLLIYQHTASHLVSTF